MGEQEEKKVAAEEAPKPAEEKGEKKKEAPAEEKAAPPPEEAKKDEKKSEGPKEEEAPPPPPPPREIVLKVFMHCEGCARKVRRCLRGFEGVEDVITDCRASKVVVKGEKADPVKVLERVQRKSHRKVELVSPIPEPPSPDDKPPETEPVKSDDKKEEAPPVITVIMRVYMHCDACAQEIKRRIQKMKGVESAEPDLKGSQVTVRGVIEPQKLVDYVYKRTGKHALILKVDPEKEEEKKAEESKEEEKKTDGGDKEEEAKKEDKEEVAKDKNEAAGVGEVEGEESSKLELKKHEMYYYHPHPQNYYEMYPPPPRYNVQEEMNGYPPQMFSDENPNACSVM